jgi:hypothetical protein
MKYAVALALLTLPAMLAAKASCPMAREAGAAYSLVTSWQASPLLSGQVL